MTPSLSCCGSHTGSMQPIFHIPLCSLCTVPLWLIYHTVVLTHLLALILISNLSDFFSSPRVCSHLIDCPCWETQLLPRSLRGTSRCDLSPSPPSTPPLLRLTLRQTDRQMDTCTCSELTLKSTLYRNSAGSTENEQNRIAFFRCGCRYFSFLLFTILQSPCVYFYCCWYFRFWCLCFSLIAALEKSILILTTQDELQEEGATKRFIRQQFLTFFSLSDL